MQKMFSKQIAATWAGIMVVSTVLAHPGHAPTDAVAQVSEPLAGPDHLLAFLALTGLLLLALRVLVKARASTRVAVRQKARK